MRLLLLLVLLLLWVNKMKISCLSVVGGWQTVVCFADGAEWPLGPVFNRVSELWDWQRENLFNVVSEYKLMKVA